jgi:DedD protein
MRNGNAKRGGDRVLESRHLIGLFLGVVVLCGVFFTLGYVMGHTQPGAAVHASDGIEKQPAPVRAGTKNQTAANPAESESPEWDFYPTKKGEEKPVTPAAVPTSASQPIVPASAPKSAHAPVAKSLAHYQPPRIPRGAFVLQVAALKGEGDALALTDALQQKRFPAFVLTPGPGNLYRVQVGPFADKQSSEVAKRSLEREGFKAIIKH